MSKALLHATLAHLKRFFQRLAAQSGYKSRLQYSDADYFNLSDKDSRIAPARREQKPACAAFLQAWLHGWRYRMGHGGNLFQE
ncbi:MAG: hypothetical protein Q8M09_14955 [Pseudomonadota bacterium]|nr:hypothetical protein [Pseudomonadota bacterium]MDP1905523.1 hypothetical protein [Pseudomonadota bacterium]